MTKLEQSPGQLGAAIMSDRPLREVYADLLHERGMQANRAVFFGHDTREQTEQRIRDTIKRLTELLADESPLDCIFDPATESRCTQCGEPLGSPHLHYCPLFISNDAGKAGTYEQELREASLRTDPVCNCAASYGLRKDHAKGCPLSTPIDPNPTRFAAGRLLLVFFVLFGLFIGCQPVNQARPEPIMPVPVCPVSGQPLGAMGDPVIVLLQGRAVALCCEGCREPLLENPDKYLGEQ